MPVGVLLASYPGRMGGERRPGIDCLRMRGRFRYISVKLQRLRRLSTCNNIRTRYLKVEYVQSCKMSCSKTMHTQAVKFGNRK